MKKLFSIGFIFIFLLLDFAALDDITTGNEPSLLGEYLLLFLSFLVFGYLFGTYFAIASYHFFTKILRNTLLKSYHIHHSLLGLVLFISAFSINPLWLKSITGGFGVGLLLHHTVKEGLIFVTKK